MDTGRKILNLRKDLGVAQNELATSTEVTPSALSRIEAGVHQPRGPVALRLARKLGVTVDYLLDDSAPYPPPGREILANLDRQTEAREARSSIDVTEYERNIILALRELQPERRVLLEHALNADREQVRYAAYLLGAADELPGMDAQERARLEKRTLGGAKKSSR